MASINVNSGVSDQFYRYKMPRIIAKVEGKGNGIKTVIVNMPDIAKALARPPTYPTKFFGCELGAQTQFDLKNDRYIVNGSHDASKLQSLLDGFIRKFVLCPECQNPETNLVVKSKAQTISQRCIACGHTGTVDMRHKLTTFILKNPPDQEANQTPSKSKKSKKDKKDEKKDERGSPEVNAQEQMAQQRAAGGVIDAPPETSTYNDDDDWGEDVSEEAIKERMKELSDAAKSLALSDDVEKTIEDRLNIFWQFVKDKVNTGTVSSQNVQKDIVTEAERLEVKDKSTLVLVELLFDEKILQQMKKYRKLFLRVCHENQKAQRYLLGGIEQLVGKVHRETLMPKVAHIFKSLYDFDIVDEEVLLEWGEKVSKKYVSKEIAKEIHEKAQPVLEWLKEAEEESEDDSEDEGKVQVDFSSTEKVGEQKIPVTPVTPNNNTHIENHKDLADDDDDDDIDIDNI